MAAARNALGIVAIREGDFARGEKEIEAALAAKPDVRLAHYNLALLAEQRHDLTTAIKEYRAEIDLHPDSYKAWFNLGKVYESVGDRVRQEEAFRKAIDANPDFAEGYLYLAKLYLESGQKLDEAVELAKKGNTLHPRPDIAPLGHYLLADLYNRLGRPADSDARGPDRAGAREDVAVSAGGGGRRADGKIEVAARLYAATVPDAPDSPIPPSAALRVGRRARQARGPRGRALSVLMVSSEVGAVLEDRAGWATSRAALVRGARAPRPRRHAGDAALPRHRGRGARRPRGSS